MSLYIRGETGDRCGRHLLLAIEDCEQTWGDDRAYRDILHKLDLVEQALELVDASPGHRAALRAHEAKPTGQEPSEGDEERMEVQRARD